MDARRKSRIVACNVLRKEIVEILGKKESDPPPIKPTFLPDSLHCDFTKMGQALDHHLSDQARDKHGSPVKLMLGYACHPEMEKKLSRAHLARPHFQNCLELLLGPEVFHQELENGAYFLTEAWARDFKGFAGTMADSKQEAAMREIFQSCHKYVLAIKTPCSDDFTKEAEAVARQVGLPLKWISADLEYLRKALATTEDDHA